MKWHLGDMVLDQTSRYPSLVLVQPRKTRPYITERLLMGRKESNQANKQTKRHGSSVFTLGNKN